VPELSLFNQVVDQVYGLQDMPVADVAGAFDETDLSDLVTSPWGQVPVAVDKACTLLDITCTQGQLEGFGDDPDAAGAGVIAQAFEQVIGPMITPVPTTTTTSPTTTTTATTVATTTSVPAVTTSSVPHATTTAAPSTTGTGPPTTGTSVVRPVTAPSSVLAFTGTGTAARVVVVAGAVLVAVGVALLVVVDGPRRLLVRPRRHRVR